MKDKTCVEDCTKCDSLVESRTQIVNGVGPIDSDIVIIGEAPGKNEDKNGEPFVGRSGSVLDDSLESNGLKRRNIRITNTVRCKPPENRNPYKSEIENCSGYLENEISEIEPNVVVTLGRVPTESILDEPEKITSISGNKYSCKFGGVSVKVIPCIHPAATLYDSSYKDLFESSIERVAHEKDTN